MRALAILTSLLAAACGGGSPPPDHASGHPGAERGEAHRGDAHRSDEHGDHAGGHGHHGQGHHHDFSDVERFSAIFDDPERDEWQRPAEVVTLLALDPGATVADVGAGTGYFAPHLSTAVGPDGRVLALDVEPNMVAHMQERFAEAGLQNAEARVVQPDDPGLEPESVDRVLVVDTWHHIEDRARYAERLAGALRPGGSVLVIDFTADSPRGPPPQMRLTAEQIAAELREGGLEVDVLEESLPYQYAVRGRRPE